MTIDAADPSAALEALYRDAAEHLRGLPVFNPALRVEAVGFARWQGCWLGVIVTPWFMNLTLAPAEAQAWVSLPVGGKRHLRFPAGDYEFIGARDRRFGEYQTCSLFSPMREFGDHETARLVARLAREALLEPAPAEPPARPAPPQPVSKRDFLRGRLGGDPAPRDA